MKQLFILLCLFSAAFSSAAEDLQALKAKYKSSILYTNPHEAALKEILLGYPTDVKVNDQMIVELTERYDLETSYIQDLLDTQLANGTWADIDYTQPSAPLWEPKNHALRLLELTKAYANEQHELYQNAELANGIHRALKFWFATKPIAGNWWNNQIGIPKIMGGAFLLFEDQMTEEEMQGALEVMNHSKISMTAQNRVWLSGNVLVKGMMLNDTEMIAEARDAINAEIKLAYEHAEGIKIDHSFHQHGPQQQYGNYGAAFLATISFWAYILNDSPFALDKDKFQILADLTNEGFRRILWKNHMDINCLGRQLFENAQRHKAFSVMFSANALEQSDASHRAKYRSLIDENLGTSKAGMLGHYHFWYSDMTVQRTPSWMASLKMSSQRVIGTERNGAENVKGYYLADGALYTYIDGDEYANIFPNWDWTKIPGVTSPSVFQPSTGWEWLAKQNLGEMVGNVNDGAIGLSVMELSRNGLTGRKAWLFTPDYIFCLGAEIASDSAYRVSTTIEQALAKEDLKHFQDGRWQKLDSLHFSGGEHRFFHKNIGYIVQGGEGHATVQHRSDSWHEVMHLYPPDMMQHNSIYTLSLDHGASPSHGQYQYFILPDLSASETAQFNTDAITVIQNNETAQAVRIGKESYAIAIYKASETIKLDRKLEFSSDNAGLFLLKKQGKSWHITASDPSQSEERMNIRINKSTRQIILPDGEYRGQSVVLQP